MPLPRIDIPQNLGQSHGNLSPATLWLSGNWHAITLDGTPDGQYFNQNNLLGNSDFLIFFIESFERMSRESASELKGALEKLKDS